MSNYFVGILTALSELSFLEMPRKRIDIETKIEDPWKALQEAISSTLQAKETNDELSMIMQACSDLIMIGKLDEIYKGLIDQLKAHFEGWRRQLQVLAGDPLLTLLSDKYDDFKRYCKIFPTFYTSYDQQFSKEPHKILKSIRKLFNDIILSDKKLFKKATTPSIIDVITNAQKGTEINLNKIQNIIRMYYSFNDSGENTDIFQDFYEKLIIEESLMHDSFFSNNFEASSFSSYLTSVQAQYKIDSSITEFILSPEHSNQILELFNKDLLEDKQEFFLEGEEPRIAEALKNPNLLPLKFLIDTYEDFKFNPDPIYETCSNYIKSEMLKLAPEFQKYKERNSESDEVLVLVQNLINKAIELSLPYEKIFTANKAKEELDKCIAMAWNDESFNIAINFNDFIDILIRNKIRGLNGYIKDTLFETLPRFYKYVSDKVSFNQYYEASYIRRLIKMKSALEEYESQIIPSFQKVSTSFMKNLDVLKKALSNSEMLKTEFKSSLDESEKGKIELEPFVFAHQNFPLDQTSYDSIPKSVINLNEKFKNFYINKYKGRELTLIYQGSLVELKIQLPAMRNRTYTITCDLLCATLITSLSFPKKFSEITEIFGQDKIAKRVCSKLHKKKVILKNPAVKSFEDSDVFTLNPKFSHDRPSIYIQPVYMKDYRNPVAEQIETEKNDAVRCAMARILKQRGQMEYNQLFNAVLEKLNDKFTVKNSIFKNQLPILESKEEAIKITTTDGETIITYVK